MRRKQISTLKWNKFYLHLKYYTKFGLWCFAICVYPGIVCPLVETFFPEEKIYAIISWFVWCWFCYLMIDGLTNNYKINVDKTTELIDYETEMIEQVKRFNSLPHQMQTEVLTRTRTLEQAKAVIQAQAEAEAQARAQAQARTEAQTRAQAEAQARAQTRAESNLFVEIGSWIGWFLWFIFVDVIFGFFEFIHKRSEELEERERRLVEEYPEEYKFINGHFRRRIYLAEGELPDELNLVNVFPE